MKEQIWAIFTGYRAQGGGCLGCAGRVRTCVKVGDELHQSRVLFIGRLDLVQREGERGQRPPLPVE
jgi:hypothetical protein